MNSITNEFINKIESYGFKAGIISIKHIEEIQADIENIKNEYKDVNTSIGKFLNGFDYDPIKKFSKAESIIIIAVPQPMNRMYFTLGGEKRPVIMPPTYLLNSSLELEGKHKKISEVTSIIENVLSDKNFKVEKIHLPCKLIASRSGLGQYGKNNICYINNESSFYWMGVYISDMPCEEDSWQKAKVMDVCTKCNLCSKNCPTGAIAENRFLVHAGKCITLQNESEKDFPMWLNTQSHNSLIGCMRCQMVCPINRNQIKEVEDLGEFDEKETSMILAKAPLSEFSEITYKKLELINFIECYDLLARNLNALIGKYK